MKYTSYILTVIIAGVFVFGCSTTPNGPDVSEQQIEFQALSADLSSIEVDPEPETDHVITDVHIERLEKQINRLRNFLDRISRYERKHPNDEARKLIRQASHLTKAASEAFEKEEYRQAFRLLRRARKLAHDALKILRPETDKAHDGG